MREIKSLNVRIGERNVGKIALTTDKLAAFEYDAQWLEHGFSISPLSLPLRPGVFIPKRYIPFRGLFGIFADSLPDGWGMLLVDRMLAARQIDYRSVTALLRLSIVGASAMGALSYFPETCLSSDVEPDKSLDELAAACAEVFKSSSGTDLDELYRLGGSSGGARPKVLIRHEGEDWIVKFPASTDAPNAGTAEYAYSICAGECGIEMPKTKLFPSKLCAGYFGVKRFDRVRDNGTVRRVHMASAAALLETDFRIPSLDYNDLMLLTLKLTKDYGEVEKLFRQMAFNVFAHNRDDHAKNFSFIYNEDKNRWQLSPAYDLTYSNSLGGEHATCVNGSGKSPTDGDLLAVAGKIGMDINRAKSIAAEIKEKTLTLKKFAS